MKSGHTIQFRIAQATPMLYVCVISVSVMVVRWIMPNSSLINKGLSMSCKIKDIDEELPSFFESLRL